MNLTVQQVIEHLTNSRGPIGHTVDTLKAGTPQMKVTGIAVAFMPTCRVIERAAQLKANLLITHEGELFSHHDKNELKTLPFHKEKQRLIQDVGMAIYRLHDDIHYHHRPDGIMQGLLHTLEWESHVKEQRTESTILTIPAMTALEIAAHVKRKLAIEYVRVTGNLSMPCSRIGILVGYRGGGELAIPLFEEKNLDLILYGEGPEWETPEYVRDAVYQGKQRSIIVLGHAESEEPGMRYLANSLSKKFPSLPVHFIPEKPIFQIL